MRDFTYVNDTVAGVLAAMDYTPLQCGEVYNIGSGHPSPLHTMLEGLQRELNTTSTTVCYTLHSTVCCMVLHCMLHVASFPGRSHLQYLIAYSMQIRRGKAWEISSRAITSGRQKVDTRGAVPDSSNCRFVSNHPWRYERWMVLTLPC